MLAGIYLIATIISGTLIIQIKKPIIMKGKMKGLDLNTNTSNKAWAILFIKKEHTNNANV